MPRNAIYYIDFRNAIEWRFRVMLTPPDDSPLSLAGPAPEWGEDPAPGSGWLRVQGNVLFVVEPDEEAGHTDVSVGWHTLPTMKLMMNLYNLRSTSDLRDLWSYIIKPQLDNAGDIGNRTFATSIFWQIKTDRGDSAKKITPTFTIGPGWDADPFDYAFEGVQQQGLVNEFEHDDINETSNYTVELLNVIHRCLQECQPDDIADALFADTSYPVKGWVTRTHDAAWLNAAADRLYWAGQEGGYPDEVDFDGETVTHEQLGAHFNRICDLWHAAGVKLSNIYRVYNRLGSTDGGAIGFYSFTTTAAGSYAIGTNGTPIDALRLAEFNYADPGTAGADLDHTNRWFISKTAFLDDTATIVGGYMFKGATDDASPGMQKWKSLYTYLDESLMGGFGKIIVRYSIVAHTIPVIQLYCAQLLESFGADVAVGRSDFRDKGKWSAGAGNQMGATIDIATSSYEDPGTIENKAPDEDLPDLSLVATLHNLPDSRDYLQVRTSGAGSEYVKQSFGVYNVGFRVSTIYYFCTDSAITVASGGIAVRASDVVRLRDGTGTDQDFGTALEYPTPSLDGLGDGAIISALGDPITELFIVAAFQACTPWCVLAAVPHYFSNYLQTLYENAVSMRLLWWHDIGQRIAAADFADANIFCRAGETWYSDVPGSPIVLRGQDDWNNGTYNCKLLALP